MTPTEYERLGQALGAAMVAVTDTAKASGIQSQLEQSLVARRIAEELTKLGVPDERALRNGELVVTMCDEDVYCAAVWQAAQRIYMQQEATADCFPLVMAEVKVRQKYLTLAMHAIRGFESVLTGMVNRPQLEALVAAFYTHRQQAIEATERRRGLYVVESER